MSSHDPDPAAPSKLAVPPNPPAPPPTQRSPLDEEWLKDFYKECGREITLAYTTLNQMQNWAIVVQAAIAAAVGAIVKSVSPNAVDAPLTAMVVGASIAYLFTLRFFIRAVICYTNLLRWNTLQKEILLNHSDPVALSETIRTYYYEWRATTPRAKQLASNLKLGFSLLFLLPVGAIVWGIIELRTNALLRGFVTAAVLGTLLEAYHFSRDSWFDDPSAAARRRSARPSFPGPSGDLDHVWGWFIVAAVSVAASALPSILRLLGCRC
jgi:hypothetical protein